VKALSRFAKWNPRKVKLWRVAGGSRSKPPRFATDSGEEQGPGGGCLVLVPYSLKLGAGDRQKRHEGNGERRARAASPEGKTLKS